MILKLFEKLNNPIAVTLILAAILGVNGFLFYQQRSTLPQAEAPEETPAQTSEANGNGADEPKGPEEAAKGPEDEPDDEPADESGQNGASEEEPSEEPPPEGEPSEEEPQNNGAPDEDSQNGEEDQASDEPDSDEPDSDEPDSDEPDSDEQLSGSPEPPLAGLGDALEGCEGDREDCVRDFVSQVSPESSYIGGRTDLASAGEGENAEIMYFEDPGMDTCQFERGRHESEDELDYTVILVGPGSFNDERGDECIPTT